MTARAPSGPMHVVSLGYPAVVAAGAVLGGWACWASFLLGGTAYPLLDLYGAKRPFTARSHGDGSGILYLYLVVQIATMAVVFALVARRDYQLFELLGLGLSMGTMTGGIGLPAAHELIHRTGRLARLAGLGLLACVFYMHFAVEHLHGHHRHVATPLDPATARRGEGLWIFLPRSVLGQLRSAWRIERGFRARAGQRINRLQVYAAVQVGLAVGIYFLAGPAGLAVAGLQAVTAIVFLEAINYVEHYGLTRTQFANGRYEPVGVHHSWNTPARFTNALAFNLGLHPDHHTRPATPFTQLRHQPDAPQLPAGYLVMIALAALPPLWRRVIDPRLPQGRPASNPKESLP